MIDSKYSIEIKNLSKSFTLKNITVYGGITKIGKKQILNDISLNVKKGEVVGIIGKNGSGKSTLLKIITKIMEPDSGNIEIQGKIASILELGMGFDPEASGRENIIIKCGLYGLSKEETKANLEDIILFSELGEQIDQPLRTYSSGMTAKLAFSILLYVKCDILIMDEVLSVGDASFNSKCKVAFQKLRKTGCSIILASHNINTIEEMCDNVVWIDNGLIKEYGTAASVCFHYRYETINSIDSVLNTANTGDIISMNRAGEMYRYGIGVEKNIQLAEEYFKKGAKSGNIDSLINLANLKESMGEIDQAIELYEEASKNGNSTAIIALIKLKSNAQVKDKLISEIYKLAESGNTRAIKLLADMLFQGNIIDRNYEESIKWYTKSAEYFNNHAEYQLGICYRDGLGTKVDLEKSLEMFKLASDHGYMKARIELANMFRKGIGVERDIKESIKWYEIAANAGDSASMLQLRQLLREGNGIEPNEVQASKWIALYANQTLANIEYALAEIIKQGYNQPYQKQSINWYKDSADKGNQRSINTLALIYKDGTIIDPKPELTYDLLKIGAENTNTSSIYELAQLFMKGQIVKQDFEKATDLLKKSAKMGHTNSMIALINYYIQNNINDPDLPKFIKLLNENGNLVARTYENSKQAEDN